MSRSSTTTRRCTSRPARRAAALAALVAACLAAGCSSGAEETCNDVSGMICSRLAECGSLEAAFSSDAQCVASFNGYFEVASSDDAACRQTWSEAGDLECSEFLAYFRM